MDGTPQGVLLLLVFGLLAWSWPRPLPQPHLEHLRRWVPLIGVLFAFFYRGMGAWRPEAWPHFAAYLDAASGVLERLGAVVIGEGAVLLGLGIVLWCGASFTGERAASKRAELVLPLLFVTVLGLDGGVEAWTLAPDAPTREISGHDLLSSLFAVALALTWMKRGGVFLRALTLLLTGWLAASWFMTLSKDPGLLTDTGSALVAGTAALVLGPRRPASPAHRAPRSFARWLVLAWLGHVALLSTMLPVLVGHDAWSVVDVVLSSTLLMAVPLVLAVASLRVGMDANQDALWLMGLRAWCFVPLMAVAFDVHATVFALTTFLSGWGAVFLLRLSRYGSETRLFGRNSDRSAYEQE